MDDSKIHNLSDELLIKTNMRDSRDLLNNIESDHEMMTGTIADVMDE